MSNKTEKLLEDTNEAYYWIGFLTADGSFINNKRIRLALSNKDENHLTKFSSFVGAKSALRHEKTNSVYTSVQDVEHVPKICQKFGLKSNKTKNPIGCIPSDENLFMCWLIGFIDGDGHIKKQYKRNDSTITIKLHKSWLGVLNKIHKKLQKIYSIKLPPPKINNAGYSCWTISNSFVVNKLKRFVLSTEIPFLKRKWVVINENFQSRLPASQELKKEIISLYKEGCSQKTISKELNISKSYVCKVVNQ